MACLSKVLTWASALAACTAAAPRHTPSTRLPAPLYYEVPCPARHADSVGGGARQQEQGDEEDGSTPLSYVLPGCSAGVPYNLPNGTSLTPPCGRFIADDFLSREDVDALLDMVERGFAYSTIPAGPAILDVNGGYLRDAHGLLDVYSGRSRRAKGAPPLSRRKKPLGRPRGTGSSRRAAESATVDTEGGIATTDPASKDTDGPKAKGAKSKFQPVVFSPAEYALYGSVFTRIHARIQEVFGLSHLWFTAPTFVARIIGDAGPGLKRELVVAHSNGDGESGEEGTLQAGVRTVVWSPASPHDEYWHAHADQANTAHYHWSGLVYLSTQAEGREDSVSSSREEKEDETGQGDAYAADFTGGGFAFLRPANGTPPHLLPLVNDLGPEEEWADDHTVAPRAGRLLLFSSGPENVHVVRRVSSGVRYVFSMWFTCDAGKEFETFLDGKAHGMFKHASTTSSGTGGASGMAQAAADTAAAAGEAAAAQQHDDKDKAEL